MIPLKKFLVVWLFLLTFLALTPTLTAADRSPTFDDICSAVEADKPVVVPDDFGETLREAAKQARADRSIGLIQYWRINAASKNPRQLQRIYAGVIDEGIAAGVIDGRASADAFDWEQLLAFIERMLPLILKLISLFG